MQAFGLLVVDLDGGKISTLASQLTEQGYSVATCSVSASDTDAEPAPAAADGEPASGGEAAESPAAEATGQQDNSQPFKCPACGATYATAGNCVNGHQPIATLPTDDVLAGATAEDATDDSDTTAPAATETGVAGAGATPEPAPPPAAAETGGDADPSWPAS